MTVKELKELLNEMPDESEIIMKFHIIDKHEVTIIRHDEATGRVIISD